MNPNQLNPRNIIRQSKAAVMDIFTYTNAPIASIAPGATVTTSIQIQADSNFEIIKQCIFASKNLALAGYGDNGDSTLDLQKLAIMLTDTGSGRQLMSAATPVGNVFGTAQNPFILPHSKVLMARSVLDISISNFSSAITYYNVQLSFIGRKIFTF